MKRLLLLSALVFTTIGLPAIGNAQTEISESKRKLISEMVSLFKMESQMAEIVDTMLKSMETSFPMGYDASVDARTDLTLKQKAELKAQSAESFRSFSKRFREELPQYVDFGRFIQESVYPIYDRFYSEDDIRAMNEFYRSPTGQKVISTLPELTAESQKASVEKLVPQITPLIEKLTKEAFDRVRTPPKPAKRPGR